MEKLEQDLAAQIGTITQARYINQAFADLKTARAKQESLSQRGEENARQEKALEDAEKALYAVFPLESAYLRAQKAQQEQMGSIKALEIAIKTQEDDRIKLQAVFETEKGKEPERERLASAIDRVTGMLPKYDDLQSLENELAELGKSRAVAGEAGEELQRQKDDFTRRKTGLEQELESLADIELQAAACEQAAKELETTRKGILALQKSLDRLGQLQAESAELQDNYMAADAEYQNVNKEYLAKEAAFFREQAGLLAAALQDGEPCPVCGSLVHPSKAVPGDEAPSEAELNEYKSAADKARQVMQETSKKSAVKAAEAKLAREQLLLAAGEYFPTADDPDNMPEVLPALIETALEENKGNLARNSQQGQRLKNEAARKKQCQTGLAALEKSIKTNEEAGAQNENQLNWIIADIAAKTGERKALKSALEFADRQAAAAAINKWRAELNVLRAALEQAEAAYQQLKVDLERNQTLLGDQQQRLIKTTGDQQNSSAAYAEKQLECGFTDEEAYQKALKTEEEIRELKEVILEYQRETLAAGQELDRLLRETAGQEVQDMAELERTRQIMEDEKKQAAESIQMLMTRRGINEPIAKALDKALPQAAVLQEEYLLLGNLSKTANGELTGKQKLAFEQYVQASYFKQILIQANQRLKFMTNSRFELLPKADAADLRSPTGLEIEVLDHYTGRSRSAKSLSGGESFKASLSLALGLSDVIQSHAGGVQIDTLFIDEGFGALDAESLDQAIATMAGLAAGNRLVGIISHVSEMKERIDRQIIIHKSSTGSTIRYSGTFFL